MIKLIKKKKDESNSIIEISNEYQQYLVEKRKTIEEFCRKTFEWISLGQLPFKKRSPRFSRLTSSRQGETNEGRIKFLSRDIVAYIARRFYLLLFFFFLYNDSMNFINAFEAGNRRDWWNFFKWGEGNNRGTDEIYISLQRYWYTQRHCRCHLRYHRTRVFTYGNTRKCVGGSTRPLFISITIHKR